MPPRPSITLAPARPVLREALRAAALFAGGTVGGLALVLAIVGRAAL